MMNRIYHFLASVLLLITGAVMLHAQAGYGVTGTVINDRGERLVGARVELVPAGPGLADVSAGHFVLGWGIERAFTVRVSCPGYVPTEVTITPSNKLSGHHLDVNVVLLGGGFVCGFPGSAEETTNAPAAMSPLFVEEVTDINVTGINVDGIDIGDPFSGGWPTSPSTDSTPGLQPTTARSIAPSMPKAPHWREDVDTTKHLVRITLHTKGCPMMYNPDADAGNGADARNEAAPTAAEAADLSRPRLQ